MARTTLPFQIDGKQIDYRLVRRSRQKHINIRVSHSGEIIISAPMRTGVDKINQAVRQKARWVESHVLQIREQRAGIDELSAFPIDGKIFHVKATLEAQKRNRVIIDPENMLITAITAGKSREIRIDAIKRALIRLASSRLKPEVQTIAQQVDVSVARIYLRNQKTRWGSSSAKGNLSLNWRLVMTPPAVRQYLIYHELAHQLHMNHSPAFWAVLEQWCPEYSGSDKWLKKHSYLLGLFR